MVHHDSSSHAIPVTEEVKAIPVASMVESIVGCKWSVGLLRLLADGCRRPSALLRASAGLSAKVMNERLRKMLRFGIVRRTVFGEKPPVEVEYLLTPFGRRFLKILDEVRRLQESVEKGVVSGNGEQREEANRSGHLVGQGRQRGTRGDPPQPHRAETTPNSNGRSFTSSATATGRASKVT